MNKRTFKPNSSGQNNKDPLKARIRLCPVLGAGLWQLKKSTIQSILKKQKSPMISLPRLSHPRALLPVLMYPRKVTFEPTHDSFPGSLSPSLKSKQHRKILYYGKTIKELNFKERPDRLPIDLVQVTRVMQNLHKLTLTLHVLGFIKFLDCLRFLPNLQQLSLNIFEPFFKNPIEEPKASRVVQQFGQCLASQRKLQKLQLSLSQDCLLRTHEIGTAFFSYLGELPDSCRLQIQLRTSLSSVFKASQVEKFLARVQVLIFTSVPLRDFEESKSFLYLVGLKMDNFEEILTRCASLQVLHFHALVKYGIPLSLGRAKNLEQFHLQIHEPMEIATEVGQLLEQAENLQNFSLAYIWHADCAEDLSPIHSSLAKLEIKHYSLTCKRTDLRSLCEGIAEMGSLESLVLDLQKTNDLSWLKVIFENLPRLKSLKLTVKSSKNFPVKSLSGLHSIEELRISIVSFDKKTFLKNLPRLPKLKDLYIAPQVGYLYPITMADYQTNFKL